MQLLPAWLSRCIERLCACEVSAQDLTPLNEAQDLASEVHDVWGYKLMPFLYTPLQVGSNADGKLIALEIDLYSNGGNSLDLTAAVMDRALMHIDCVYKCPNTKVVGYCCRTNHASNTAFRGFGGPQV